MHTVIKKTNRIVAAHAGNTTSLGVSAAPSLFFGMAFNILQNIVYPVYRFGLARFWDSGVTWADIETAQNVFDWSLLDYLVNTHNANNPGVKLLYTFGHVPNWANGGAGIAAPPTNFQFFYDFVTAIATRYKGRMYAYELWNEPNSTTFWTGTTAQMFTLASNAYTTIKGIDPNAIVITPSANTDDGPTWLQSYFALGGASYCDAFAYHTYPYMFGAAHEYPEFLPNIMNTFDYARQANSLNTKPLWQTEFDAAPADFTDPYNQPFLATNFIIASGNSLVVQQSWYQHDNLVNGRLIGNVNGLNPTGIAYQVVYGWLTGSAWISPPTRQANANAFANTTFSGASAGTPGSLPSGWSGIFNPDVAKGITTQVVSVGTFNGINYMRWRIFGTATAGAAGAVGFNTENLTAAAGQFWYSSFNIVLFGGSLTNLTFQWSWDFKDASTADIGTYLPNKIWPLTGPTVDIQKHLTLGPTITNTATVRPGFQFNYTVGNAIDLTIDVALPSADNGSIWQGDLTRNGVGYRIVWDSGGGPTSYNTPAQYTKYQDLAGIWHPIVGNNISITNSPVFLSP